MKTILAVAMAALSASVFAGNTCTWTGGAGDGKWATAGNWDTAPASGNGDTVVLVNTGSDPITIDRGTDEMSIYSLRFGSGSTAAITLTGGSLTLTSTAGTSTHTTADGEVSALYDAAAGIEMTVACPIDLPSGTHSFMVGQSANLHVSGVISGKGGIHRHATTTGTAATGTLKLSAANTFEGGVTLRGANTILAHTNALGKVGKTISMFFAATYRFAAAGDWDYAFSYKEGPVTFYMDEQVRFLRDFTEFGAGTTATFYLGSSVKRVDFMGAFGKAASAQAGTHKFTIDCPTGAAVYFHGKVVTETLVLGVDKDARKGWDVHFLADGNEWTAPLNAKFSNVHIYHPNFFHEGESPYMDYPRQTSMGCYHLHGNTQTIGHLTTENLAAKYIADAGRYFSTDTAATLTMKNEQNASANVAFMGPLTLVYDATGAYTQAITNRTNGMTGDIVVSNGTLRACGTTSFKNANEIRIEDGGTFELDVSTASALANVKAVRVADGGMFRMTAATPNPFAGGNKIILAYGANLVLPANASLSIPIVTNGAIVADGRYQSQDGTDATAVRVDWLAGAGVLSVSLDGSYWQAAVDGNWKTPERWTSVPAADGKAFVVSDGGDFTVTVDADTVPLKTIDVSRTDAGLTTLDVGAKLETRYGKATFGKGAKVSVTAGGTWETTSTDAYSSETKFLLKDGATFSVDGGLFHATNFCGILSVGNGSSGAGVTNTLRVTDGTMEFKTRASADSGMIVNADGRLEITGGTARFVNVSSRGSDRPFRHEKGGTVEVCGTGRLELSGTAYFSGVTRFSGDARLSAAVGGSSPYFYINPIGSGDVATFEFTDSAGVDTTGFATYGGVEGAYMFNQFLLNNDVDGGTARLLLHGDGLYHFNAYFAMASHRGAAELDQTGGFFRTYSSGIRVGASLYADQTTAPNATAVWRMKDGAAEIRATDAYANHNRALGFVVGDGTWVTPAYRGLVSGRVELSGGAITNMSNDTILGFGLGDGYGEMIQTGGEFVRNDWGYFLLGFGGGEGRYVMTNGTTTFRHEMKAWIGGATTNAISRYLPHCPDVDTSTGLLRVWGGTFTAENSDVCLGARGTGCIEIGPTGTATVRNLVLSNAVAGVEASSLKFEYGASGIGRLHVADTLTVNPGSKLEIDFGDYDGMGGGQDIITFGTMAGTFDPANIVLTGNPKVVARAKVSIRPTSIRVSTNNRGLVVLFR